MKLIYLSPLFLLSVRAQTITSIDFAPTITNQPGPVGQTLRIQGAGLDSVSSVAVSEGVVSGAAIGPTSINVSLNASFHRNTLTGITNGGLLLRLNRTSGPALEVIYSFTPAPNLQSVERRTVGGVSVLAVNGSGFVQGVTRLTTYCGSSPFEATFTYESSSLLYLTRSVCTAYNFLVAAGMPINSMSNGARIGGTNYSPAFSATPLDTPIVVNSAQIDPSSSFQFGPATHQVRVSGGGFNGNTRVFLNGTMLEPGSVDGTQFTEVVTGLIPPGSAGAQLLAQGGQFAIRVGHGTLPTTDPISFAPPPAPVLAGIGVAVAAGEYTVSGQNLADSFVVVDCGAFGLNPATTIVSRAADRLRFRLSRDTPCENGVAPRLSARRAFLRQNRLQGFGVIGSNVVGLGTPIAAPSITPDRIDVVTVSRREDRTVTAILNIGSTVTGRPFAIASTAPWLTVSLPSGITPASPSVLVNPVTLNPGVHRAELRVVIEGATTVVPVTATVAPRPTYQSGVPETVVWRQGEPLPADIPLGVVPSSGSTRLRVAIRQDGGGDWISSNVTTGETPYVARLRITPQHLEPNVYTAVFRLSVADDPGLERTHFIRLMVLAPKLRARPEQVRLSARQGASDFIHLVEIAGPANGPPYEISITPKSNWLRLAQPGGQAPETLVLMVSPGRLNLGVHRAEIRLEATPPVVVPVELWLTESAPVKLSATKVTAYQPSRIREPQTVQVDAGGLDWSASVRSSSGDTSWLNVSRNGSVLELRFGAVPVGNRSFAEVEVRNSEGRTASVTVEYLHAPLAVDTVRRDLLLVTSEDGAVGDLVSRLDWNPGMLPAGAVTATEDGGAWLSATAGVIPGTPIFSGPLLAVEARAGGLRPGTYRGTVLYALGNLPMQHLGVTMLVRSRSGAAAATCRLAAGPLVAALEAPEEFALLTYSGRSIPARIQMRARIVDPCGEPVTRTSGVARAVTLVNEAEGTSTSMADLGDGVWTADMPAATGLNLAVSAKVLLASGTIQSTEPATARWIPTSPVGVELYPMPVAVANAASGGGVNWLSPGMTATVYGRALAPGGINATGGRYEEMLGRTRVLVGGRPMKLQSVFDSQINFLVPNDLPLHRITQLVVERENRPSPPLDVMVNDASPGIYQGFAGIFPAVLIAGTSYLAANIPASFEVSGRPARRGDYLTIYATGLGAVTNAPEYGGPAGVPLARVIGAVTVTIGGADAPVIFAGLAPGFIGLYQVNAQVPEAAPSGDKVPLVLRAGEIAARTVEIAVW